jgi:hypothetical protein
MKNSNELSSFQAKHDTAEHAAVVPDQADEPCRHFLIPWRLKPEMGKSLWQQHDDAGCGSGPVF